MHEKCNLLFFLCLLLSPLVYSELEIPFDYSTPSVANKSWALNMTRFNDINNQNYVEGITKF